MLFRILTAILTLSLVACNPGTQDSETAAVIQADAYLSPEAQENFLYSISRYICKYPAQAGKENMWDARFDEAYAKAAKAQKLIHYYVDSASGTHYFMVSRIAPSIHEKYVGLAGKRVPTADDALAQYEEVFRTWKMLPEEHREKSEMLFRKLIKGHDLSPYYTANSNGVEYIEFPDEETWYDKDERRWHSAREDVLEPYRHLKNKPDSVIVKP